MMRPAPASLDESHDQTQELEAKASGAIPTTEHKEEAQARKARVRESEAELHLKRHLSLKQSITPYSTKDRPAPHKSAVELKHIQEVNNARMVLIQQKILESRRSPPHSVTRRSSSTLRMLIRDYDKNVVDDSANEISEEDRAKQQLKILFSPSQRPKGPTQQAKSALHQLSIKPVATTPKFSKISKRKNSKIQTLGRIK